MMRSLIKCCRMIISARFALRKENFQQKTWKLVIPQQKQMQIRSKDNFNVFFRDKNFKMHKSVNRPPRLQFLWLPLTSDSIS